MITYISVCKIASMGNFNSNLAEASTDNKPKLNSKVSKIMDIRTFEDGIKNGQYTDEKGTAYLILNGTLYNTYNVYIDRRRVTKSGSVVSFESLIKSYGEDNIKIRYDIKERRRRSLTTTFQQAHE